MSVPKQKPGLSKQDYRTPPDFLESVKRRLRIEEFTFDLAADAGNTVADDFYTEADDAIIQDWSRDGWNWLNPPFADLEPWVAKASKEGLNGAYVAMLVPASVGANWWREWVEPNSYVVYLNGRLAFIPDKPKWLYPKDLALLLYTPWPMTGHEIWHWKVKL